MRSRASVAYSGVREATMYVVEFRALLGNTPSGELCLHLREPDLWVSGPKGRELDVHRCYVGSYRGSCLRLYLFFCHCLTSGSPM